MKIHYATVERGNEENPQDDWSEPICNTRVYEPEVENDWDIVDCKKCLRLRVSYEKERQAAMEQNIRDMAEFVAFNKEQDVRH